MADDSLAGGEGVDAHQPGGQRWAGVEGVGSQGLDVDTERGDRSASDLTLSVVTGVCHNVSKFFPMEGWVMKLVSYLEVGGKVGGGGEVVAGRQQETWRRARWKSSMVRIEPSTEHHPQLLTGTTPAHLSMPPLTMMRKTVLPAITPMAMGRMRRSDRASESRSRCSRSEEAERTGSHATWSAGCSDVG